MSSLGEELRFRSVGILGLGMTAALFSTVREEREGTESYLQFRRRGDGVIFVLWHDQLLPLTYAHRNEGAAVLVSEHADGEYITRVIQRLGFRAVRGSSTRGGARGLRELLRAARSGRDLALTVDGPRGPRHRFKEGALVAAQLAGLPMIPVAAAASSAWRFDSWDRFMVPRPFSRLRIAYGDPVWVGRDADRRERKDLARRLGETLERLTAETRAAADRRPPSSPGAGGPAASDRPAGRGATGEAGGEREEDGATPA